MGYLIALLFICGCICEAIATFATPKGFTTEQMVAFGLLFAMLAFALHVVPWSRS